MKKKIILFFCAFTALFVFAEDAAEAEDGMNFVNAVVKLEVATSSADLLQPWRNNDAWSSGSGVVIENNRILTCAHCVANATFIRIRKSSEDNIYKGRVEFVDHDCDLAIVAVDEDGFMDDIVPMKLGETPPEQSEVLVIGYPMNGSELSYTRGIVSRIEDAKYTHSMRVLLQAQIDAAINAGNSGGPVLDMSSGEVVGIAFQSPSKGEGQGRMIHTDIISHFLTDIKDGKVDSFGDIIFIYQTLENKGTQRFLKMGSRTGILLNDVSRYLDANSLKKGDVLLEVDGYKVSNSGTIRLPGNIKRSVNYPIYMHQIGDEFPAKVLRDGEEVDLRIKCVKTPIKIRGMLYDKNPDYYVIGGLVFSTISLDYFMEYGMKSQFNNSECFRERESDDEEAVAIVDILANDSVDGYDDYCHTRVMRVNDTKVKNLAHLVELLEGTKEPFVKIYVDCDNFEENVIILDMEQLRASTAEVLKTYRIPAASNLQRKENKND